MTRSQAPTLSYPVDAFVGQGRPAVPAPRALDRSRRDFYSQNWSLSLVQELPLKLTGVAGYVGSDESLDPVFIALSLLNRKM